MARDFAAEMLADPHIAYNRAVVISKLTRKTAIADADERDFVRRPPGALAGGGDAGAHSRYVVCDGHARSLAAEDVEERPRQPGNSPLA